MLLVTFKCICMYMPANKFFILYTGLLSIILLYDFTTTQGIQKAEVIGKKLYLRFFRFSSYNNLSFVAYNYTIPKTFRLKLPDPFAEHNLAPVLNEVRIQ